MQSSNISEASSTPSNASSQLGSVGEGLTKLGSTDDELSRCACFVRCKSRNEPMLCLDTVPWRDMDRSISGARSEACTSRRDANPLSVSLGGSFGSDSHGRSSLRRGTTRASRVNPKLRRVFTRPPGPIPSLSQWRTSASCYLVRIRPYDAVLKEYEKTLVGKDESAKRFRQTRCFGITTYPTQIFFLSTIPP